MNHTLTHISLLLDQLGFNDTEKRIYLCGLELGTATIAELAEKLKIHRITTHAAVEHMLQEGVFLETYYGKRRVVYSAMADGLQKIIDDKKFQLEQLQFQLDASKGVFEYLSTSRVSTTNTRLYS